MPNPDPTPEKLTTMKPAKDFAKELVPSYHNYAVNAGLSRAAGNIQDIVYRILAGDIEVLEEAARLSQCGFCDFSGGRPAMQIVDEDRSWWVHSLGELSVICDCGGIHDRIAELKKEMNGGGENP